MKRNEVYLRHILDAIARIDSYVAGMTFGEFETDLMAQDAVIRQLSVIGEAARRVSSAFRGDYPQIPWVDMVGMRNILISRAGSPPGSLPPAKALHKSEGLFY
jgi:uncharacterized protein with HEPN domain